MEGRRCDVICGAVFALGGTGEPQRGPAAPVPSQQGQIFTEHGPQL